MIAGYESTLVIPPGGGLLNLIQVWPDAKTFLKKGFPLVRCE
jgi:hypothetical protein